MTKSIQNSLNDLDTDQFNEFRKRILKKFNIELVDIEKDYSFKIVNPHPIFGTCTRAEILKGLDIIEQLKTTIEQDIMGL